MNRRHARAGLTAALMLGALVPLAPHAAASLPTVAENSVVYIGDTDGDLLYGVYTAPESSPTTRTALVAEDGNHDVSDVKVSPDGNKLAMLMASADNPDYSLYVRDLSAGTTTLIGQASQTADGSSGVSFNGFDWSRDSSTVIFTKITYTASTTVRTVYTRPADASSAATALPGGAGLSYPTYSQDGTKVAATKVDGAGAGVYVVDPGTGTATQIATSAAGTRFRAPTWSLDGSTLAVTLAHTPDGYSVPTSSDIDLLASDGAANQTPVHVTSSINSHYDYQTPYFAMDGSLWFDMFDSYKCCSGDLFQAIRNTAGGWSISDRTKTTAVDEGDTSLPRPVDDGAPTATVTLQPFDLAGTSIGVHWTPPANTPDYASVTLHRDASDASTVPDIEVHGTSYVDSRSVTVGVTYTYTATVHDGSGNTGPVSDPRQVMALNAPRLVVSNPTAKHWTGLTFRVYWSSTNPIATPYDVAWTQKVSGSWTLGAPHAWQTATSATDAAFTSSIHGQTYYFRSSIHDAFGNTGSSPWTQANVPLDQNDGSLSTGWATVHSAVYYLGSARTTTVNGAYAVYSPTSSAVLLMGDRCPTCGSVKVYVNGAYTKTVSTKSSTTLHRVVLWTGTQSGVRRFPVKFVASLAKGQVLRIDAVADPR